jgi:hypothetical protein
MVTKKLGLSYPWLSRSINNDYLTEKWIRNFIEGLFSRYDYVVSDIFIHIYPKKITIKCLIFISKKNKHSNYCGLYLERLIKFLKSTLLLKLNKNITVSVRIVNDAFDDSKILSSLLKSQIGKNPFKYRMIIKKLIDSFRKKGFRPVWWRVLENRMGKKRRFDSNRGSSTRSDSVIINKLKC